MKQLISRRSFMKAAGVTTAVAAVSLGAPAASACFPGSVKDITILYTNDVHTYIDKKSPELTYAAIAALKKSYQDAGKDVLLVDAGDHIQGTAYGSMDEGASIIQLMNAAGYDVATPGNHEFDYGMARAKEAMAEADFPYLSSNWVNVPLGNRVLPDVKYFTIGGRVIAFVGITTPETFTKSTPAYFMDKSQKRYIYDILGGDDGQKLYKAVQKSIDKAKLLADYVIGLGHLGVDPSSSLVCHSVREDEEETFSRAENALLYLRERYSSGEKVAVVSHAAFMTYFVLLIMGFRKTPPFDFEFYNTGITRIVFYKQGTNPFGDIVFEYMNETAHLKSK